MDDVSFNALKRYHYSKVNVIWVVVLYGQCYLGSGFIWSVLFWVVVLYGKADDEKLGCRIQASV